MKILLTGAKGFVGARIADAMEVVASPSLRDFDEKDVKRLIDSVQPDAIIHTAAISDIPTCAKLPEESYKANVTLPIWLAKAAPSAKKVFFSSDQVYTGSKPDRPFKEEDIQGIPTNLYAREKLEMENSVLNIDPNAVMLRATWMYDMPMIGIENRGNFLMNLLKAALHGSPMSFVKNEMRGVTYVREVAEVTKKALTLPGGAYNFGSENTLTMLETAKVLCDELGLKMELSEREETVDREDLWMDISKLRANGADFGSTVEGIQKCIADYRLKEVL